MLSDQSIIFITNLNIFPCSCLLILNGNICRVEKATPYQSCVNKTLVSHRCSAVADVRKMFIKSRSSNMAHK